MRRIAETIVAVIATAVVSLVISGLLSYATRDKGIVSVGNTLKVAETVMRPVDIANNTSEPLQGILFSIPRETTTASIASSFPLQISDVPDSSGTERIRRIKIDGVSPHTVARLLFPVGAQSQLRDIELLNGRQLRLSFTSGDYAQDSLFGVIKSASLSAVMYALVAGVFYFWSYTKAHELIGRTEALEIRLQKTERRAKSIEEDAKNSVARVRVLLLARLSEYARELEFWRDTVRKVLYLQGSDKESREAFVNAVTDNLKTYQTRTKNQPDFDVASTMADMLVRLRAKEIAGCPLHSTSTSDDGSER